MTDATTCKECGKELCEGLKQIGECVLDPDMLATDTDVCHGTGDCAEPQPSRSVQRRVAAQKGDGMLVGGGGHGQAGSLTESGSLASEMKRRSAPPPASEASAPTAYDLALRANGRLNDYDLEWPDVLERLRVIEANQADIVARLLALEGKQDER